MEVDLHEDSSSEVDSYSDDQPQRIVMTNGQLFKALFRARIDCLADDIELVKEYYIGLDDKYELVAFSEESPEDYPEYMKLLAICLNYHTPIAYDYARGKYGLFPPKEILANFYLKSDYKPGFSREAFQVIASAQESSTEQLFVHVAFDTRDIWSKNDSVDFGKGPICDVDYARDILVFTATCINKSWNIPVGYFAVANLNYNQIKNLVEICVILLQKTKVIVTGVTTIADCDDTIRAFKKFGCKWQFPNPQPIFTLGNQDLVFFPDPAYDVGYIPLLLESEGPFTTSRGEKINYAYLRRLQKLNDADSANCAKTRAAQKYLAKQNIQVKLAIKAFSTKIADALDFCENQLHLPEFKGSGATAEFVRIIGETYSLLTGKGKSLCSQSIHEIQDFINSVNMYMMSLRTKNRTNVVVDALLGLLFGLNALPIIYANAEKNGLTIIPVHKIDKYSLHLNMAVMCQHTLLIMYQITKNFQKLSTHWQIRDKVSEKSLSVNSICLLHTQDNKPVDAINYSDRFYNQGGFATVLDRTLLLDNRILLKMPETSEYKENYMMYIAGYVANTLQEQLKCEECITLLGGSIYGLKLIVRNRKKEKMTKVINYPADVVVKLCNVTEKFIKIYGLSLNHKKDFKKIYYNVQNEVLPSDIFASDPRHEVEHRLLLIRAVCEKYYGLKLFYAEKDYGYK